MTENPADDLGSLSPYVGEGHRPTIAVLVAVLRTGRQLEAWLSTVLTAEDLNGSEFSALVSLLLAGPPHRRAAGELSAALVQTSGGTTKTVQRLETRGLVSRVADPGDGRRSLVELTAVGERRARAALALVLEAFDLEIGDLDEADRSDVRMALARLSRELGQRLGDEDLRG